MRIIFSFLLLCIPLISLAMTPSNPIAEVVKIRGEATQLSPGARLARVVALGDKFVEDTSILTGPKSFIKIKFIDNSELNVGPESKIVITEMKKESAGIISLLKGRIRTEVQKDSNKPDTNKFFIKTRTAAMGVRGTDFQTIYNPENKMTSLLTYRGEVAMAKLDENTFDSLEEAPTKVIKRDDITNTPSITEVPAKKLDEADGLNKVLKSKETVLVPPGQNSFSSDSLKKSSLPVKISPVQLEALYKNKDLEEKNVANLNIKSPEEANALKSTLKVADQKAPAEGLYNEKTGDFAPKSGGFIDINTGLYVAPSNDAKLDAKTGVYVATKVGNIDADTGQYIAPKGLILDAKKGFILADSDSKVESKPELLALREDLNKNIAKDIVVGIEAEEKEEVFNLSEKFIRDRISFSLWGINQTIKANANSNNSAYYELNSRGSVQMSFDWQMATSSRFATILGIDYSIIDFNDRASKHVTENSKKLLGLSFGSLFALNKNFNLYAKIGLLQEHYLNQTTATSWPYSYDLQKIVMTRISAGFNSEFWRKNKLSLDASFGGLFTFRKRINNVVINEGAGTLIEIMPKYNFSDKKWIGIGLKFENQFQRINGDAAQNKVDRNSGGLLLKYISEF